jgi:hypothetical protein
LKVICEYDKELDLFLKEVVKYTIDLYGDDLCLDSIKIIELRNINEFGYDTDGRTLEDGSVIWVTSRLYEKLPSYNIKELEDNNDFIMLVNTLFHEMGHATDWMAMPQLYAAAIDMNNNKSMLTSFFWLEYLAEKRSSSNGRVNVSKFCDDFVKRSWRAYKVNFETCTEDNFFYLNKALSYFMGRTLNVDIRKKYMTVMSNVILKEYIEELDVELKRLEGKMPFDEVSLMEQLYEIMNKYFKKFKQKYAS